MRGRETWPELLNVKDLCQYLGISRDILRRLKQENTFPGYIFPKYYSKKQIDIWLMGNHQPPAKLDIQLEVDKILSSFGGAAEKMGRNICSPD